MGGYLMGVSRERARVKNKTCVKKKNTVCARVSCTRAWAPVVRVSLHARERARAKFVRKTSI